MNWQNKSVLVTGAGGFIGSHLTERLVELGADVHAFLRYNSRNDLGLLKLISSELLEQIDVIAGDLRDVDAVRSAQNDVSIIFHLGSLIAIPYSYVRPRETIETNILGTLNVLSAAKEGMVDKVIHTSTSEVYGTAQYIPIDEQHPLQGQSPYSASKIGADKIAESFYRSYDLPIATIRPFNTFGPRQSARAVIPTIISQALTANVIHLGSVHTTRDYTYVRDTVDAFIKVAAFEASVGEVINIGSNFEISIGNIAERIGSVLEKEITITPDRNRIRPNKSEVDRLWCDNSKAQRLLNWKPTVSFEDGIKHTIEWIAHHQELYDPRVYTI